MNRIGRYPLPGLPALALPLLLLACGERQAPADDAATPQAEAPATATGAAATAPGAITEPELQSYQLDLDRLRTWHQVQLAGARRPDLELYPDQGDDDQADASSATRMLQDIEAHPEIPGLIRGAGMQPREFVLVTYALAYASIGHAVARTGQPLPRGTNQSNVDFVAQHRQELVQMQQEQDAVRRAARQD